MTQWGPLDKTLSAYYTTTVCFGNYTTRRPWRTCVHVRDHHRCAVLAARCAALRGQHDATLPEPATEPWWLPPRPRPGLAGAPARASTSASDRPAVGLRGLAAGSPLCPVPLDAAGILPPDATQSGPPSCCRGPSLTTTARVHPSTPTYFSRAVRRVAIRSATCCLLDGLLRPFELEFPGKRFTSCWSGTLDGPACDVRCRCSAGEQPRDGPHLPVLIFPFLAGVRCVP